MKHLIITLFLSVLTGCMSVSTANPKPEQEATPLGLMATTTITAKPTDPRYVDSRYCGEPARDAVTHIIIRDPKVPAAYRKIHACPATGMFTGACPLWALDHVIPMDSGGCDAVWNMQWLPAWLKSCAGYCKDRWERKINCKPVADGGTGCVNEIVAPP